jgi:hypothetical protein
VAFPISFQVRLWASAIAAGAAGVAFDRYFAQAAARHLPLRHITEAVMVAGLFGIVYFTAAILAGVPEARATLGRVTPAFGRLSRRP